MQLLRKPRLLEKFRSFHKYVTANQGRIGTKQRGIDLNLNNACNLKCEYCFTEAPKAEHAKDTLPTWKVAEIADQADELGIFEFDLQGGELLLRKELLFEVIAAIRPERFYLYLTTNGYHLDEPTARRLAELGVSRVSVSVDSMDGATHDRIRGKADSWRRAMEALKHVQNAGMDPYLNITVGHYNAFSEDLRLLCQYSEDQRYTTLINVAVPSGMWLKLDRLSDVMVDERDKAKLLELRKQHGNILRNLWNPFDRDREQILGCNTVNRLYITPVGDVLPCPYVHIKIGNVFEQSLRDISEFGFKIRRFREHSDLCLAGEDQDFVKKHMSFSGQSIFAPVDARKAFTGEEIDG